MEITYSVMKKVVNKQGKVVGIEFGEDMMDGSEALRLIKLDMEANGTTADDYDITAEYIERDNVDLSELEILFG